MTVAQLHTVMGTVFKARINFNCQSGIGVERGEGVGVLSKYSKQLHLPKIIIATRVALVVTAHNRYLSLASTGSCSSACTTTMPTNAMVVQLIGMRCQILVRWQIPLRWTASHSTTDNGAGQQDQWMQHVAQ